ncbi:MAG: 3-deoxy-D-manno-octulosonic acid transferase [Alphaproteobacteria bacterium]|nr:3-deoxy-D-manno-octulosonic acid transferase [Alphaproteobacteria bacterium]
MLFYKTLITIFYPLIRLYLGMRRRRGKEDAHPDRFAERFGRPSLARPNGFLIWLHGASVGEINSLRGLIGRLCKDYPRANILLTSGSVTSANIAKSFDVIHQYSPIDVPFAVRRFIRHWRPDLAIRVDSDLWPVQLDALRAANVPNFLINGAMTEKSLKSYLKYKKFWRSAMQSFTMVMAKSAADARRLQQLGAKNIIVIDNLKYTTPPPLDKPAERKKFMAAVGKRPVWHAAVLGEGESEIIMGAHRAIIKKIPNALLLITPRHPSMKAELAHSAGSLKITFRSDGALPKDNTDVYVADTLGEMGLFYRCAERAFMGRSLLPDCRGSSPIEAMQLDNVVITGKYTCTFDEVYDEMAKDGVLERVADAAQLAGDIEKLLTDKNFFAARIAAIKKFIAKKEDTLNIIMKELKLRAKR